MTLHRNICLHFQDIFKFILCSISIRFSFSHLTHLYFILPLKNIFSFTAYLNSRLYTLSLDREVDKYNNLVIFWRFRLALMFSYCIVFIESACNVYICLNISIYLMLQKQYTFRNSNILSGKQL